jgi:hypothetical protein
MAAKKKKKRAALDHVLQTALDTVDEANGRRSGKPERLLSLYDCAIWMLYACTRGEARLTATELVREDVGATAEGETHSPKDQLHDVIQSNLDVGGGNEIFKAQQRLAQELDPGYKVPILQQVDWIYAERSGDTKTWKWKV